jgi:hypothetical protein
MRVQKAVITAFISLVLSLAASGARAQGQGTSVVPITLSAVQHVGSEAIDVSGTFEPHRPLSITLVSTISRDLPDVVLSRTIVVPDVGGAFSVTLPIAPGFTRGSVITVFASPLSGGPAARATYRPDFPNVGTPFDEEQKSIR